MVVLGQNSPGTSLFYLLIHSSLSLFPSHPYATDRRTVMLLKMKHLELGVETLFCLTKNSQLSLYRVALPLKFTPFSPSKHTTHTLNFNVIFVVFMPNWSCLKLRLKRKCTRLYAAPPGASKTSFVIYFFFFHMQLCSPKTCKETDGLHLCIVSLFSGIWNYSGLSIIWVDSAQSFF